jgi:hypothetical protein
MAVFFNAVINLLVLEPRILLVSNTHIRVCVCVCVCVCVHIIV